VDTESPHHSLFPRILGCSHPNCMHTAYPAQVCVHSEELSSLKQGQNSHSGASNTPSPQIAAVKRVFPLYLHLSS